MPNLVLYALNPFLGPSRGNEWRNTKLLKGLFKAFLGVICGFYTVPGYSRHNGGPNEKGHGTGNWNWDYIGVYSQWSY